jgi:hypothetical protein
MAALTELKVNAGTLRAKLREFPVNENSPVQTVGSLLGGISLAPDSVAVN